MLKMKKEIIGLLMVFFVLQACDQPTKQKGWLKGTSSEKDQMIEKQFRGFDKAMVEVGYRFQELYWAGEDENWEYANYQVEKIEKAMRLGLERRPKRAKSAQYFLTMALPNMKQAVDQKNTLVFKKEFQVFMQNCNSCHAMEKVSFFKVKTPSTRNSPIQ